eukprot:c5932_g1_i1.p1 GENE.c5932_g1_i1~~c5932_g1_i1.p1  ORF type:complete len:382 (+),score=95.14 c5932_g1_i1:57-1202(+)
MVQGQAHKLAIGQGISCHAWNKDRTQLAFSPNNSTVLIYGVKNVSDSQSWELLHELKEHDQLVSAIDWAPNTNRIVTVSHDRNAYVWRFEEGTWQPTLVILRFSRAATSVKWSSDELKFAVGSGAQCVAVCSYDDQQNWWVSKLIRKHQSTVLSLDWHPSAPLLATGAADNKCRVVMAYVKDVDSKEFGKINPYNTSGEATRRAFGEVIQEYTCQGWVHSVRWSPSGKYLAFATHDSSVTFAAVAGPIQVIKLNTLPFRSLLFLSDSSLAAVGHEVNPHAFKLNGDTWSFVGKFDKEEVKVEAQQSAAKQAMAMFQNQAKKATSDTSSGDLPTLHQNSVSALVKFSGEGDVSSFTSSGLDGYLVHWNLGSSLDQAFAALKL